MKAICCTCGTNESNPDNGYCKNGHDDWLEERDFHYVETRFQVHKACSQLSVTENFLQYAMQENLSLEDQSKIDRLDYFFYCLAQEKFEVRSNWTTDVQLARGYSRIEHCSIRLGDKFTTAIFQKYPNGGFEVYPCSHGNDINKSIEQLKNSME